jgi:peroxiredoxin
LDGTDSHESEPVASVPRRPLASRHRNLFALATAVAIVVVVAAAVVFASSSNAPAPRSLTLRGADRDAPRSLVRAAEQVGFHSTAPSDAGAIEDAPAVTAHAPLSSDLLPVGTEAPAFTLQTPTGDKVSLSDFRGKAVLLELFATWCPHCATEAPHLRKLANSLPKNKVAFVSIDGSGGDAASVFAYHAYFDLPFPALLDHEPGVAPVTFPAHGKGGPVSRAYRLGYFPTFYVIDPQGRITWRSDGEQPDALLRQELERAAGI